MPAVEMKVTTPDYRQRFLGKCECGGNVRGVGAFERIFSWCTKCTPVQKIDVSKLNQRKAKP